MSLRNFVYRVLRRGEKYTGTDNVYLAKGGFWFMLSQFLATCSGLILAVLFARLVDKGAYGTYSYLTSWGAILAVASLSGMSGALSGAVARGNDRTLFTTLRARLYWGLAGTVVALAVGGYYLLQGRMDFFFGFLIVGVFYPLSSSLASWGAYLTGKRRFDLQAAYSSLVVVGTALAITGVMLISPTPLALVAAAAIAPVVGSLIAFRLVIAKLPPHGEAEPDAISYGKRLSVIDVLTTLSLHVDRILLFTLLGARETAVYAFALAPTEQIKGLLKSMYAMALPKVAARSLEEVRVGFFRKAGVFLGGISVVVAAYILAAPFLFRVLFPAYMESVVLSQWLAVSLIGAVAALPSSVFTAHKLIRENFLYQVITSAASLIMLGVFIWFWGLPGAVAARVAGRLFGAAFGFALIKRSFDRASRGQRPSHTRNSA